MKPLRKAVEFKSNLIQGEMTEVSEVDCSICSSYEIWVGGKCIYICDQHVHQFKSQIQACKATPSIVYYAFCLYLSTYCLSVLCYHYYSLLLIVLFAKDDEIYFIMLHYRGEEDNHCEES